VLRATEEIIRRICLRLSAPVLGLLPRAALRQGRGTGREGLGPATQHSQRSVSRRATRFGRLNLRSQA
jgi:hypothetical protein